MPIRVKCCYSHLTRTDCAWREADYSIKKFVDAIKGRQISGYAHLRINPEGPLEQLEEANAGSAFDWFGDMAADLILEEGLVEPILVPFPDSHCSTSATRFSKTLRLAAAVQRVLGPDVSNVLRFDTELLSACACGGTRDAGEIYRHLRVIGPVDVRRPHVLLDDVVASGGHVQAGVRCLQERGADVKLVVCAVSASLEPVEHPFDRIERVLPDWPSVSVDRRSTNPVVNLVLDPADSVW